MLSCRAPPQRIFLELGREIESCVTLSSVLSCSWHLWALLLLPRALPDAQVRGERTDYPGHQRPSATPFSWKGAFIPAFFCLDHINVSPLSS